MIAEKLQNNFTTPEQSKRLLELGVPADSADMLWDGCIDAKDGWVFEDFPIYTDKPFSYYQLLYRQEDMIHILPCWSVGRLMEIYDTCFIYPKNRSSWCAYTKLVGVLYINYILDCYKNAIADKLLDFSKLNEYGI